MKGEYGEHNHKFPSRPHLHHPLYLPTPSKNATETPSSAPLTAASTDGASVEVARRPRGRPRGSKNKPKPQVIVLRDAVNNTPIMSPFIFEISSGADVVAAVRGFCRRKGVGVCVLSGSGAVSNVTLRQPSPAAPGSTVTFHGSFEILSVSATLLPQSPPPSAAIGPPPVSNMFSVSLAGPQGQIVGGFVAGPLIAAGTMYVVAASFNNPSYHQLPVDEETMNSGSTGNVEGKGQSPAAVSGSGGDKGHVAAGDSCGVSSLSMYGCHTSDVMWSPPARAQQPPPY